MNVEGQQPDLELLRLLELLPRHHERPINVKQSLDSFNELLDDNKFEDDYMLGPYNIESMISIIVNVLRRHPKIIDIQEVGIKCLNVLLMRSNRESLEVHTLQNVIEVTLNAMRINPNNKNLQEKALTILSSISIMSKITFDFFKCFLLIMKSMLKFKDCDMNLEAISICLNFYHLLTNEQKNYLGSNSVYMETILDVLRSDLYLPSNYFNKSMTLLLSLSYESPMICEFFLRKRGEDLDLFTVILKSFIDESGVVKSGYENIDSILEKVLGILYKTAEISYLRSNLIKSELLSVLRNLMNSSETCVSHIAAGIFAQLACDEYENWFNKCCDNLFELKTVWDYSTVLDELEKVVLNLEKLRVENRMLRNDFDLENYSINFNSLLTFIPLLNCNKCPSAQSWAIWTIHYLISQNGQRYIKMLIEENVNKPIANIYKTLDSNSNSTLKSILEPILLWSLPECSLKNCGKFLKEAGSDLNSNVLNLFTNESETMGDNNRDHQLLSILRKQMQSPFMCVSYIAAEIFAHLACNERNNWSCISTELNTVLNQLRESVLDWEKRRNKNNYIHKFEYDSLLSFIPLLNCNKYPSVQLWAIWVIHYLWIRDSKRFTKMLINENVDKTIMEICKTLKSNSNLPLKTPFEQIANIFQTLDSNSNSSLKPLLEQILLWSLSDELLNTSQNFLEKGGFDLFLKFFTKDGKPVDDNYRENCFLRRIMVFLIKNFSDLSLPLMKDELMPIWIKLLESPDGCVGYFAAEILSKLVVFQPNNWSCNSINLNMVLIELSKIKLNSWFYPCTADIAQCYDYDSLNSFIPLLNYSKCPSIQLCAIWGIYRLCCQKPKRYIKMLMEENVDETIANIHEHLVFSTNTSLSALLELVLIEIKKIKH